MYQFSALTIPDLSEAIQQWETSANRQLVTWIGHSQCWTDEIPSAVAFLCGAFPHAQPPGFNPIIISLIIRHKQFFIILKGFIYSHFLTNLFHVVLIHAFTT